MTPLLAARRRAGDRSFERLYRKHVHAVYRYALAVLHNEADAEDVTQTTFLNAYRAFQRGERPHTPHNWLIKIAHNVCRQRFRDSSRRPREVEFDDSHAPRQPRTPTSRPRPSSAAPSASSPSTSAPPSSCASSKAVRTPRSPQVLDVSVAAVETLMFRARRALREQLEGGLTCDEAEQTLSRLQKRKLSSADRGALRAHLRECKDCATLERRQRAQRAALDHLGAVPLPASLAIVPRRWSRRRRSCRRIRHRRQGGDRARSRAPRHERRTRAVEGTGNGRARAGGEAAHDRPGRVLPVDVYESLSVAPHPAQEDRARPRPQDRAHDVALGRSHTNGRARRAEAGRPAERTERRRTQPVAEPPPVHLRLPLPPPPPPIQLPVLPPIQVPPVQLPPLPPVLPPPPPLPIPPLHH